MKYIFLSILGILIVANAYSQQLVTDFASAMTFAPVGKKISITDVIYVGGGGTYESVEQRSVRPRRASRSVRNEYVGMGHIIDSLGLINYRADTLYVLSTYRFMTSVSEYFKVRSRNTLFFFAQDASGEYVMRDLENQYDSHTDPRVIASDSLFYNTIFSWDIDKLIRMIKVSGGYEGGEYFMSATRIILQNNRVIAKEIVNFKPTLFWHE